MNKHTCKDLHEKDFQWKDVDSIIFFVKVQYQTFVLSTLVQRKPIILRTPLNSSDRELVTLSECSLDSNVFKGSQGSVCSLQNPRLQMMFICVNISQIINQSLKKYPSVSKQIGTSTCKIYLYITSTRTWFWGFQEILFHGQHSSQVSISKEFLDTFWCVYPNLS